MFLMYRNSFIFDVMSVIGMFILNWIFFSVVYVGMVKRGIMRGGRYL